MLQEHTEIPYNEVFNPNNTYRLECAVVEQLKQGKMVVIAIRQTETNILRTPVSGSTNLQKIMRFIKFRLRGTPMQVRVLVLTREAREGREKTRIKIE